MEVGNQNQEPRIKNQESKTKKLESRSRKELMKLYQKLYLSFLFLMFGFAVNAQDVPFFDVQHYNFAIQLSDKSDTIKGQATVELKFLKDAGSFALNLVKTKSNGKGMQVLAITEGNNNIPFVQDSDVVHINTAAQINSTHSYTISYQGIPSDGLIISTNKFGHRTFFGDNWPNRAHNWLPCADYPGDKAPVDFVVTAPDHYQVVSNGLKVEEKQLAGDLKLTRWKETAPLPTKVMVIGVAEFAIDHTGDADGVPVYAYVFPENKDSGFKSYAYAMEILPFFNKKFGPYAYEKLANVQSKTIFGGMENAGAIFYFENSVTSKGVEELMAHEIAHQWFGDAASEKNFSNLWLSEGFATYMTDVYLENKYGIDTLKKRLIKDRIRVLDFEKERLTPVVDTNRNYMKLLNANSYQKGGWILHMLRRKLGEAAFWKGIRAYYAKYKNGNANTNDLRNIMEQASGQNLEPFFKQWLFTAGHPQLKIDWKYDASKKMVSIKVTQLQNTLYDIELGIAIDGKLHTIPVKDKNTTVQFIAAQKPVNITPDPNVNLLAGFELQ